MKSAMQVLSLFTLLGCQTPKQSPYGESYSLFYRMFNAKQIQFEYECGQYPNCQGNSEEDTSSTEEEDSFPPPLSTCFSAGTPEAPPTEILEDVALQYGVPIETVSYEQRDMDGNGVKEWFVYTEYCYAVGCSGSLYIPKKCTRDGWCYAGSGLDVLINYNQPEDWTLSCLKVRTDLERYDENDPAN